MRISLRFLIAILTVAAIVGAQYAGTTPSCVNGSTPDGAEFVECGAAYTWKMRTRHVALADLAAGIGWAILKLRKWCVEA